MELTRSVKTILNVAIAVIIITAVATPIIMGIMPESEITNENPSYTMDRGGTHVIEFTESTVTVDGNESNDSSFAIILSDNFSLQKIAGSNYQLKYGSGAYGPDHPVRGNFTIEGRSITGHFWTSAGGSGVDVDYECTEDPFVYNPLDEGEIGCYKSGTITVPNGTPVYISSILILGVITLMDDSASVNGAFYSKSPYRIDSVEIAQGYSEQNGLSVYDRTTIELLIHLSDSSTQTNRPDLLAPISISISDADDPVYKMIGLVPIILILGLISITVAMFLSQRQR